METIFENLTNPSWWFTGVFFALLTKYVPELFKFLKKRLSRTSRSLSRLFLLKLKLKVKSSRHNIAAINYESVKAQSYFTLFLFTCCLYIVWFAFGSLAEIQKQSFLAFIILIMPIYIIEFIWLRQNMLALSLIREYNKVRYNKV